MLGSGSKKRTQQDASKNTTSDYVADTVQPMRSANATLHTDRQNQQPKPKDESISYSGNKANVNRTINSIGSKSTHHGGSNTAGSNTESNNNSNGQDAPDKPQPIFIQTKNINHKYLQNNAKTANRIFSDINCSKEDL